MYPKKTRSNQVKTISDWKHSYWVLQQKFRKAIEDIRFLKLYIERKERVKGKNGKNN